MGKRNHNTAPSEEEVLELLQLLCVENTDKCTSKWLHSVERFRKTINYEKGIDKIETTAELEDFLCKFITWLKHLDGNDYKAESIHNCYASIARYLKEHSKIKPVKLWDSYYFSKALRTIDGKMKK